MLVPHTRTRDTTPLRPVDLGIRNVMTTNRLIIEIVGITHRHSATVLRDTDADVVTGITVVVVDDVTDLRVQSRLVARRRVTTPAPVELVRAARSAVEQHGHESHTLCSATETAAYTVTVVAEVRDPVLNGVLRVLHEVRRVSDRAAFTIRRNVVGHARPIVVAENETERVAVGIHRLRQIMPVRQRARRSNRIIRLVQPPLVHRVPELIADSVASRTNRVRLNRAATIHGRRRLSAFRTVRHRIHTAVDLFDRAPGTAMLSRLLRHVVRLEFSQQHRRQQRLNGNRIGLNDRRERHAHQDGKRRHPNQQHQLLHTSSGNSTQCVGAIVEST